MSDCPVGNNLERQGRDTLKVKAGVRLKVYLKSSLKATARAAQEPPGCDRANEGPLSE